LKIIASGFRFLRVRESWRHGLLPRGGDLQSECVMRPTATKSPGNELLKENRPTVLVTGSTGLIGSRVVKALSGSHRVVGLDVKSPQHTPPGTEFVACDLTNSHSVADALRIVADRSGGNFVSVIHLAAYYDFSGEPSPLYESLTVEGTRRLLQQLHNYNVEQFVFSSSLLVMKPVKEGDSITEASPTEAAWDYPESKLKAEDVITRERRNIRTVVLRIAGVYDEDCHSVPIAQQISRIYQKDLESYFFPGDTDHGQAFIHLDDLIRCLVKTVERRKDLDPFELLLVAEPDVMSYAELQERLGELIHGQEWPTIRLPKIVAKAGAWVKDKLADENEPAFIKPWMIDLADAHYPVDIRRAQQKLAWSPRHRLRDTLDEMIAALKRDPPGWYKKNGLTIPEMETAR
jgi:nucleoside-diphosphate-sugar epimerase